MDKEKWRCFRGELQNLINQFSIDDDLNAPDYILADLLYDYLYQLSDKK